MNNLNLIKELTMLLGMIKSDEIRYCGGYFINSVDNIKPNTNFEKLLIIFAKDFNKDQNIMFEKKNEDFLTAALFLYSIGEITKDDIINDAPYGLLRYHINNFIYKDHIVLRDKIFKDIFTEEALELLKQ